MGSKKKKKKEKKKKKRILRCKSGKKLKSMAIDYYKILQVDRSANDDELKSSYRKLVMKWHPDKNPNSKKKAEAKFKKISQAYDVLSDPQKHAIYDQYGHEGLKGHVPPSSGGSGPTDFRFNPRSADDIFSKFFGTANPFDRMGNAVGLRVMFGENIFASFGGGRGCGAEVASGSKKAPQIEKTLVCSLEDLYKGSTKKMKISRVVIDSKGLLPWIPVSSIIFIGCICAAVTVTIWYVYVITQENYGANFQYATTVTSQRRSLMFYSLIMQAPQRYW